MNLDQAMTDKSIEWNKQPNKLLPFTGGEGGGEREETTVRVTTDVLGEERGGTRSSWNPVRSVDRETA